MRVEPLVGAGNGHGLGDGAARELVDVDLHAEVVQRLLRGVQLRGLAGGGGHLKLASVGVVEQLGVLARRHEPRADDGDNGHDEQDGERRGEGELAFLLLLSRFLGWDGAGLHGCLSHDDLLSESGRSAERLPADPRRPVRQTGSRPGGPSKRGPRARGRKYWSECRVAGARLPRHKAGMAAARAGYNLVILWRRLSKR